MTMHSDEFRDNSDAKKILKALKIALMVVGFSLLLVLLGFFIMYLWNATMASIFDLPTISYWQAVGLFILAKLFFGFGSGSGRSRSRSRKVKKRVKERLKEVDFVRDEEFREFWKGEGKQAYEDYLASRSESDKPQK